MRTPGDVFAFMQSNKIGERNALFWVAWAFVAEKSVNFKLADQIYQKGVRKLAEPKEMLQTRFHQFQRRLARHYINLAEAEEGKIGEVADDATLSRKAFTVLSKEQARGGGARGAGDENASRGPLHNSSHRNGNAIVNKPQQSTTGRAAIKIPNKKIEIFRDDAYEAENGSSSLAENKHWKSLGGHTSLSKENEGTP